MLISREEIFTPTYAQISIYEHNHSEEVNENNSILMFFHPFAKKK